MPRAKSIQIYLKDGLDEDDMLLALWESCKRRSRPQVVFRRMLMRGFDAMVAEGELPPSITEEMQAIRAHEGPTGRRKPSVPSKTDGLEMQGAEVWSQLHGDEDDLEPMPEPSPRIAQHREPKEEQRVERPSILDDMMPKEEPTREEPPRERPAPSPPPPARKPEPRDYQDPPRKPTRQSQERSAREVQEEGSGGDEDSGFGFIGDIM